MYQFSDVRLSRCVNVNLWEGQKRMRACRHHEKLAITSFRLSRVKLPPVDLLNQRSFRLSRIESPQVDLLNRRFFRLSRTESPPVEFDKELRCVVG